MTVERISWDKDWMEIAKLTALRSTDPKHRVGCVIVNKDNTSVLSIGYNGDHKGGSNSRLSLETGKSGFIHAENNALIKMDYHNPCIKKIYVTLSPCYSCAQQIINAGIREVIYLEEYSIDGIKILEDSGIQVGRYDEDDNVIYPPCV